MQIKISTRARQLRITVAPGGVVTATVPRGMSRTLLDRFLTRKAGWIARAVSRMKKHAPAVALPRTQYRAQRSAAQAFVRRRTAELNMQYNVSYRSITIRNQKTRWGSCSRKGNLSFNYRILLLPPALADYVIVHELCHLQEFNHSKRFWELMERALPAAKELRKQLRRYQLRVA